MLLPLAVVLIVVGLIVLVIPFPNHTTIGGLCIVVGIILLVFALVGTSDVDTDVLAGAPAFLLARKLPLTRLRA